MTLPTPDTNNTAGLAGANWPVSLGGRNYMVDFTKSSMFTDRSIPLMRNQADTGGGWSEASLNPDDLVRRSAVTWHKGHGQVNRDLPDADPARYHVSGGVNVWSKGKLTLMPGTTVERTVSTSAYTDTPKTRAMAVASRAYVLSGTNTIYTSDTRGVWATATGTPAVAMTDMCTDGRVAYMSFAQSGGTSAIYTATGTSFSSSYTLAGADIQCIGFAKGRLLVGSSDGTLRNPTTTGALPAALMTLPTSAVWLGFAEGNNQIYAAARISTGSYSQTFRIYRTAVKPDGTALDTPVVAATLPNNEQLLGMTGYLGFVALLVKYADATMLGGADRMAVRLCEPNGAGDLVMGPLIPVGRFTSGSSLEYWGNGAFAAEGRYLLACAGVSVGFTPATIYGEAMSVEGFYGIARLDLSTFVADLAPAVSFDLGVKSANLAYPGSIYTPCAVVRWQDYNSFLIPTMGFYRSNSTSTFGGGVLVADGLLWLGEINYDLTDQKTAMYIDILLDTQDTYSGGSVEVYGSTNGVWPPTLLGTVANTDSQPATIALNGLTGSTWDLKLKLKRDTNTTTKGPVVKRITMRSFVAAERTNEVILPLVFSRRVQDLNGREVLIDTAAELAAIKAMLGTVVVLKMGTRTSYVQVKDYQFDITSIDQNSGMLQGVCSVKVQEVSS